MQGSIESILWRLTWGQKMGQANSSVVFVMPSLIALFTSHSTWKRNIQKSVKITCAIVPLESYQYCMTSFQMSASRSILGPLSRSLVAPGLHKRSLATSPHLAFGFQDPQIPGWTSVHQHGNTQNQQGSQQHPTTLANGLVPIVIEQTGRGERSYDIYSRSFCFFKWLLIQTFFAGC